MKVHEALSAVMADVQAVKKGDVNKAQGWSFRGVDAVVNAVGPMLRKHEVCIIPRVIRVDRRDFPTKGGGTAHECIVEVEYTIIGPEGDSIAGSSIGESADHGDKGTAQAMSVAYRTWWLQALCIPTDEPDPDHNIVERGPEEIIPVAEAKTRLLKASDKDIASQVWNDRKEPIGIVALNAMVDVARGMHAHNEKKAAAAAEAGEAS